MTFLLDTNVCIRILNDSCESVTERFRRESPATVALCAVVVAELFYGARKSRSVAKNLRNLDLFFAPFHSHSFDDDAAHHYGSIRAELARAGTPIGANDLLIAAIARSRDLTVVTHNVDEFARIVGLRVEDWEESIPPQGQ